MANPFMPPKPGTQAGAGTLSRRLVFRTTVLVAVLAVVLSGVTLLATFQVLTAELDERLTIALNRTGRGGLLQPSMDDPEGSGMIRIDPIRNGSSYRIQWPIPLSKSEMEQARADVQNLLTLQPGVAVTMPIDKKLGAYRVMSNGSSVIGLPYSDVIEPVRRQSILLLIFTLVIITLGYFAARKVVERSLLPLNRLADTASKVAGLPLATGVVDVPVRVDPADTNPESEVGRVGHALNQMLDHVEHALDARHRSETKVRQFVADASHELRNPLAAIHGYAELTRHGRGELPPDIARALERIEGESDRMSALVEDLLLLARLDAQPALDLQPTDITEVVLNAVSDAQAAGPDHQWRLDLADQVIIAPADRYRLQQVVANLLANARTHTPAGTTVWTRLYIDDSALVGPALVGPAPYPMPNDAGGGFATIEVIDNGPGVPPEIRDSIFERFTRADASRVRQAGASSTGLGLAIVAAVVAAHRGNVTLDSPPDQTRFTIRIPCPKQSPNLAPPSDALWKPPDSH
jgi:two-component system OmpR family sensor kinase